MTHREMAADEVERVLGYLANGRNNSADLPFEAARVRAHIAALRARAEAAEADKEATLDVLRGVEHVFDRDDSRNYCPECGTERPGHDEACALGHALHGAFRPGAGYRAKVRADLLRELAKQHADAARLLPAEKHHRGALHEELSESYKRQATREEQG